MQITQSQIDSMANSVVAIQQQLAGISATNFNTTAIAIQGLLDPFVVVIQSFANENPVVTASQATLNVEVPVAMQPTTTTQTTPTTPTTTVTDTTTTPPILP